MRMQHLFLGTDIAAIYQHRESQYRDRINSFTVDQLASRSLDELVTELVEQCRVEIPVLHENRIEMTDSRR